MQNKLTRRATLVAFAAATLSATAAWADFPERGVTIIAPVGAGGGTDTHARALAAALEGPLGVPVSVVNRPGAGGYVGAQEVVNSRADGYTIMVQSYGTFMLRAIGGDQPVDPLEDFKILGVVGELYTGPVTRNDDQRFSDMESFKAWASENPDFTYGFSGNGSWHNAAAVSANGGLGIEGRPVVFKGGGATRAALLGGQTDIAWMGVQQLAGFEDQLTMLAMNSEERYPLAEDIPTFADLDLQYTLVTSPMVVAAPAGVPDDVAAKLEAAVMAAAQSQGYGDTLRGGLAVPRYLDPAEGQAYLQSLWDSWGPVADLLKLKRP